MSFTETDRKHMLRALQIARRAEGRAEPNPMVGCVLVKRGRVIGEGYHRRYGTLHAERDALSRCDGNPRGATAYVTLEPCCHHGRQPPCTEALIEAGVKRVVAALPDVDPRVAQRGFRILRKHGIAVEHGLLADDSRELTAPYRKWMQTGLPWVILKWAQSVDGVLATQGGDSKWITDRVARHHVHTVRARVDAILVGRETVQKDDPMLTARDVSVRRVATRVVLDSALRTPPKSQLVQTAKDTPLILFCQTKVDAARRRRLERAGCDVVPIRTRGGGLDPTAVLQYLGKNRMTNLVVEGGGSVLGSFWDAGLADEVHAYIGARLVGGRDARRPLSGKGVTSIADAVTLSESARLRRLGSGWLLATRLG